MIRSSASSRHCQLLLLPIMLSLSAVAEARTLKVGQGQEYQLPSEAAKVAQDGDVVAIESGEYFDCAIWEADGLVIEGQGDGVVITDKACEGKALFVIRGDDVTVRNITFTRARVPDHNGAGIRHEGGKLTVEKSRFVNNENGILTAPNPTGEIYIRDSAFIRNGKCEGSCAHGVYINRIGLLSIERTIFRDTRVGHHIKSRALRTVLIDNTIEDGETGTSSYLVDIPIGGSLIMRHNILQKGANTSNRGTAVMIGAEGVLQPSRELIFEDNVFTNKTGRTTVFVNNLTATEVVLKGNTLHGQVRALKGDGQVN